MFNKNYIKEIMREVEGKHVRAVMDQCSQGEPDGYVLKHNGNILCGNMWFHEARALSTLINGAIDYYNLNNEQSQ